MRHYAARSPGAWARVQYAVLCATLWLSVSDPARPQALQTTGVIRYANGGADSGWVPFELFEGKHIYFSAAVNGHAVSALLDSGASLIVLNEPDAKRLGVTPEGSEEGVGVGGVGESKLAQNVTVTVGRMTISAPKAVAVDETEINQRIGHPQSLALGGEAFQNAVVDIDFPNHRLAFRDPVTFEAPGGAQSLTLSHAGEIRAVDAEVEARPARMLFDLGNGSVYLYPRFWNQAGFLKDRPLSSIFAGGWTGAAPQKLAMLSSVTVGTNTFATLPATLRSTADFGAADIDGNLGLPIWSRFHLIVDFPHDRVYLVDPIDTKTPFSADHTGLALRRQDDGWRIDYVAPNSPAAAAHLKSGDRIIVVENLNSGVRASPQTIWTSAPPSTTFRLILADGRTVNLTTAQYF